MGNYFGFAEFVIADKRKPIMRGFDPETGEFSSVPLRQIIFKFSNNRGASVIKGPGTYGYEEDLWELAVLQFHGEEYYLDYETDLTGDVLGYLSEEEVAEYLTEIMNMEEVK